MPTNFSDNSEINQPSLRCPACSSHVQLPAVLCTFCGVDLRTAYIKVKKRSAPLTMAFKGGIFMLALVGLAGVATFWVPADDPVVVEEAASVDLSPLRVIKGAPAYFSILAAEYPILLRPYIIVYETRATIMSVNERIEKRQKLLENIDVVFEELELKSDDDMYSIFVKLPPGQRIKMLKEMESLYDQPKASP